MGFFEFEGEGGKALQSFKGLDVAMLHKKGCQLCPLNNQPAACHQHMKPTGVKKADLYVLGTFPSKRDDKADDHFTGSMGEILRMRIPESWDKRIRWNNIVRTMTPGDRDPEDVEIECCRPSVVEDIERTKPLLILGIGPLVLQWVFGPEIIAARGDGAIGLWSGRCVPVTIGKHNCWFLPTYNTKAIADSRRFEPRNARAYGSDLEFKFALDIKHALRMVNVPLPAMHTREKALNNVAYVTGHKEGDLQRVRAFLMKCAKEKVIGLDYETKCLRPYVEGAKILTASVATQDMAFAFPFDHPGAGWSKEDRKFLRQEWRRFLRTSKCRKVSHHLGFEQEWSAYTFGLEVLDNTTWDDSLSQAFLLDERPEMHSLEILCVQHFGLNIKAQFKLDKDNLDHEKLEDVLTYNGVDAKYHRALFFKQRPLLAHQKLNACYAHQLERVTAATMTTLKGVPINHRVVEKNFADYTEEQAEILTEINALKIVQNYNRYAKAQFRPSNTNDVSKALMGAGIKLEATQDKKKKRKTVPKEGEINYSTTEEALMKVKHPLARAVIRYRKVAKLLSTYVIPVRRTNTVIGKDTHKTKLFPDGLLHPTVSTTRARTWRTTSDEPNIQNWPKRGPSKIIRRQVDVSENYRIVAIDYAGIQARNVAMESLDKGLIKHYWDRYDIHSDWLERLLKRVPNWMPPKNIGIDLSTKDLHKERRSVVKNGFVFPSFFGAVGKSIAGPRYLGIPENHAISLSEEFFDEFPDVKQWHEDLQKFYKEHGYVTGWSEYRRRAPIEVNQLINAPIQADETIIVCGAWSRLCKTQNDDLIPSLMVHDDLTFIWPKKDVDKNIDTVIPIMLEQVHGWERSVPMQIDVSVGKNWEGLESIGEFETTRDGGWHEVTANKKGSESWDVKHGKNGVAPPRRTGWE